MLKKLALKSIKYYQDYLSLDNSKWAKKITGGKIRIVCKFEPSCSHYTYQAIDKYGVIKGILMGSWRILRCNPFSKGGHDPVK